MAVWHQHDTPSVSPSLTTQRAPRSLGTPCWLSVNTVVNRPYSVSLCVRKSFCRNQDRSNYTTVTMTNAQLFTIAQVY